MTTCITAAVFSAAAAAFIAGTAIAQQPSAPQAQGSGVPARPANPTANLPSDTGSQTTLPSGAVTGAGQPPGTTRQPDRGAPGGLETRARARIARPRPPPNAARLQGWRALRAQREQERRASAAQQELAHRAAMAPMARLAPALRGNPEADQAHAQPHSARAARFFQCGCDRTGDRQMHRARRHWRDRCGSIRGDRRFSAASAQWAR